MRSLPFLSFSAIVAACGSGIVSAGTGCDAADDAPVTRTPLIPNDVTQVVVRQYGGGPLPPAPDGSTCSPTNTTYTIALPARELSWQFCDWNEGGPRVLRSGQTTLSESEYATVDAALRAIAHTTQEECGFDKAIGFVTLTTPTREISYYDDFYACNREPEKVYVSGFDAVLSAVAQYAR